MSVIVVKKIDNRFHIAGDSQVSWTRNKVPMQDNTHGNLVCYGKIFEVNGMTIGCAGTLGHMTLLQLFCKTTMPKTMTLDEVLEWTIRAKDFVAEKAQIDHEEVAIHGVIIKDDKCFVFYDHINVIEVTDFYAVGSGKWVAMGALKVGATPIQAVEAAIEYDLYCSGDITSRIV